jgi:HD-like signal output (HDOD) protein
MQNYGNLAVRTEPLPLDTRAAVQLLDLFRDPDHDVDRIVEFISQDPLLAAETLKRCNNAVYRGAERTTDIFEAVSRLGFYELYGIIAASTGTQRLPPDVLAAADQEAFR